jgi:hypothetical protein
VAEGQGNTERYTVDQVIAALKAAGGIKLGAAMKLRCSPTTVQNYIDRHPEIGDAIVEIKQNTLDLAETKLVEQIGKGNMTAIIFYLKTQGKERGYIERVENTGANGKPLLGAGAVTIFQLPDNERQPPVPPAPDGGAS